MRNCIILLFLLIHFKSSAQFQSAVLLNKETSIEIYNSKLTREEVYDILITDKSGDRFAKISIPYSNLSRITDIEGWVLDSEGNIIRKLRKSDIEDKSYRSDATFYDDTRIKEFYLNHNRYPYTLHYSFKTSMTQFIQIANWYPLIHSDIPTFKASLKVNIPLGYEIKIREHEIALKGQDTINTRILFEWESSYSKQVKEEQFSPPLSESLSNVSIVPVYFKFENQGSLETWSTLGDWQYSLLTNSISLPSSDLIKIRAIAEKNGSKLEIIRALYHYLQDNTRYINVSLETGGLKPYPARYVAGNKYGDCKALSNYFRNVLMSVGIESYYTKVYSGDIPKKVDTQFPSQQFNHIILAVPLENDTIWLDCTSKGAFNYLGTFTQNRAVLVVDKGKSKLVKSPALSKDDVAEVRTIELNYENKNSSSASITSRIRGKKYVSIRNIHSNYNKTQQDQIFLGNFSPENFDLQDFQVSPYDRDEKSIEVKSNAIASNIYKRYGNEIVVKNLSFNLPALEKVEDRTLPVRISYPVYLIDTVSYYIPSGYNFQNQNDSISLTTEFGLYFWKARKINNRIVVYKSFLLKANEYKIEEYTLLYDFLIKVASHEKQNYIIFDKKSLINESITTSYY